MAFVTISWSLGTFGMGVYVYALTSAERFSVSTVSTAVTSAYVLSALLMVSVGKVITRRGSRDVVLTGVLALAIATASMPYCKQAWQLYGAFLMLGVGMACLSTNMVGSTLAPWFERMQGRAISTAMLGASIGGMTGTPLLLAGIHTWGFATTATLAATVAIAVVCPMAVWVLKTRPQDIGQFPDGLAPAPQGATSASAQTAKWTLSQAMSTRQLRSHIAAFGVGQLVQVGFLSHHVPITAPTLGPEGAAMAVFSAALAAFVGRLLLARYADQIDIRKVGASVFMLAAASLAAMALLPGNWALMATSVSFGLTVGNVTTLSPMIVRREFGAASFGVVFGVAATLIQLSMAMGPSVYGILRDVFGGYGPALLLCSMLNVFSAAAIFWGGRKPLVVPTSTAKA